MRSVRAIAVINFVRVLNPFLLLIKAIPALGATLSGQYSHITQTNLAPSVDSTRMDDLVSFLYVFQCVSDGSIDRHSAIQTSI